MEKELIVNKKINKNKSTKIKNDEDVEKVIAKTVETKETKAEKIIKRTKSTKSIKSKDSDESDKEEVSSIKKIIKRTKTSKITDDKEKEVFDKQNISNCDYNKLKNVYDNILNVDKSTFKSSNDEPTPIDCVIEMVEKLPEELWGRKNLKVLDPCCGNGNFHFVIYNKLMKNGYDKKKILNEILYFNDINKERLNNVKKIFCDGEYKLNITEYDFLNQETKEKYDLVVANPPYAKILEDGKRASKNHNLIKDFIDKSLSLLKPNGYILFITPDNWMSLADRNTLIEKITNLQIIHLDIHTAKKHFKKIGSSFTWYIIQNVRTQNDYTISGIWKKTLYNDKVKSMERNYIPLLYNSKVQSILSKTIDNGELEKFQVQTSSDLHHYTKKTLISNDEDETHKYRLIHTPKQTVYASRPHKFQEGYKVFLSTTDKYNVFVDNCGMTQSIAFIQCEDKKQATYYCDILSHPLYIFLNNICRWGNFNNIRILQKFPKPIIKKYKKDDESIIFKYYKLTEEEINYIKTNM